MKRNLGVLPMNATYEYLSIDETECACENCGRPLSVAVTLGMKTFDGKISRVTVGQDCANTLEEAEMVYVYQMHDMQKQFARYKRLVAKVRKLQKLGTLNVVNENETTFFVYDGPENFPNYVLRTDFLDPETRDRMQKFLSSLV